MFEFLLVLLSVMGWNISEESKFLELYKSLDFYIISNLLTHHLYLIFLQLALSLSKAFVLKLKLLPVLLTFKNCSQVAKK